MRRHAPATARNRQPILDVLRPHLPPSGLVLEVASGSGGRLVAPVGAYDIAEVGEHLQFFAEGFDPFQMPRKHALQHHKVGNLEIEDWQS